MKRRSQSRIWTALALGGLALAGLLAPPGLAVAQTGAFGWSPDTARLTEADNKLLRAAMADVNTTPLPPAGETRSWSNPASGNAGKVWVSRATEQDGMPCHVLHYTIVFSGQSAPQDYEFTWCRTADGQWKIAP